MKNIFVGLFGLVVLGWYGGVAFAQYNEGSVNTEIKDIQSQIERGNHKLALRKADDLLLQVLSLRIQAQSNLQQPQDALISYEVLVKLKGYEELGLLREVAWSYLMHSLQGTDSKAHQIAAEYLGQLKDVKAVPGLINLLHNRDFVTKRRAAEALGEIGDKSAIRPLQSLLNDQNFLVKTSAAWALGKLGDAKGTQMLRTCFRSERLTNKLHCAHLMAELRQREVLSYLQRELQTNRSPRAREVVARALSALGDKRWQMIIERDLTSSQEETRLIAARVLGELKARKSSNALRKALSDRSLAVRIAVARSLGQMGLHWGSSALVQAMSDKEWSHRADAAKALIDVRASQTEDALRKALSDRYLLVRVYAAYALVQLGFQVGTGGLREGMARGNPPLVVLAAQYALETARNHRSLKGSPLARLTGQLPAAQITIAFATTALPEDVDEGFQERQPTAAKPSDKSKPPHRAAPTKGRKPERRPPPKRRPTIEDPENDDW
jgi:HEAT repeat protein